MRPSLLLACFVVIAVFPAAPAQSSKSGQAPTAAKEIDPSWLARARAGDAEAQLLVGESYEVGKGVSQDYTQAVYWYRKAAEQGFVEAQYKLAVFYSYGAKGVPRDYAQSAIWYRKAAEQNFAPAQYHLAILFAAGVGVPIDKAQAADWFQKAADQGYAYAQEALGLDYLKGEGVPRDYGEAFFWLAIAASSKAPESVTGQRASERDEAATHLKPDDLSRKQEQVQEWLESHPAKP